MTKAPERIWLARPETAEEYGEPITSPNRHPMAPPVKEYIRADLDRPRVKPLVWEGDEHWSNGDNEGWMEEANTPFGWGYSIEFGINGAFKADSTFGWSQDGFDNPNEAKAAAQADYERRILEALE